ncbi:haloacid dehalogenase-like hydrolase [Amycolatopsis mongoliensis]|uniref:Haloacid dehalogenase-like hydrolase n=1 Tax=Amycolatopsis mongoliensis TaxID=715475 RepID=A0A9Y2JQJ2_9PSEU|nr:haloacid dehalogenase-like hydrolase [Amycolatopsis sp. 4-36]WIY02348.1 haloacid dehalogenase-like hydrolase [Amycolatopsis sp. 4-36]
MTKKRLVLWDIDHTLVDFAGLGASWYAAAFTAATGAPLRVHPVFGGRTELATTTELLVENGFEPVQDTIRALFKALVAESERAAHRFAAEARVLPGAAEALTAFAGRDDVVQSLVTGNLPEISRHKLAAFDLLEHLDLEIGGYGTLSVHRPDLVPHAVGLAAAKHGTPFDADAVVVIGDTPNDVKAALAHGALSIAVATGLYSADELRAAGAHVVLPDLADTDAVKTAVFS